MWTANVKSIPGLTLIFQPARAKRRHHPRTFTPRPARRSRPARKEFCSHASILKCVWQIWREAERPRASFEGRIEEAWNFRRGRYDIRGSCGMASYPNCRPARNIRNERLDEIKVVAATAAFR